MILMCLGLKLSAVSCDILFSVEAKSGCICANQTNLYLILLKLAKLALFTVHERIFIMVHEVSVAPFYDQNYSEYEIS